MICRLLFLGGDGMNLFHILGPVMIGPSSSHTAGAARIGYVARKLLGEEPKQVEICLHGSFASTGDGHGTPMAIVGGLLGMKPDDERLPQSFEFAQMLGVEITRRTIHLREAHPNTVVLLVKGTQRQLEIQAESTGGGAIRICKIDGIDTNFNGDFPTLIVHNIDEPGHVAGVTALLAKCDINLATMQLYRNARGGYAVMILESDQCIPGNVVSEIERMPGIIKVTYLNMDA